MVISAPHSTKYVKNAISAPHSTKNVKNCLLEKLRNRFLAACVDCSMFKL